MDNFSILSPSASLCVYCTIIMINDYHNLITIIKTVQNKMIRVYAKPKDAFPSQAEYFLNTKRKYLQGQVDFFRV